MTHRSILESLLKSLRGLWKELSWCGRALLWPLCVPVDVIKDLGTKQVLVTFNIYESIIFHFRPEKEIAFTWINVCRYQFNPAYFQTQVTSQILLKALTNLPHTDFTLCKCMIDQTHVSFWCCFNGLLDCGSFCSLTCTFYGLTDNVYYCTTHGSRFKVTLFHTVKCKFCQISVYRNVFMIIFIFLFSDGSLGDLICTTPIPKKFDIM